VARPPAVHTTAIPEVLGTALATLRARGTLAVVGLGAPTTEPPIGRIMGRSLTVRGVVEGDRDRHTFIPALVDLWCRGDLPLDRLVTTFAFDDFHRAWSAAKAGQVVKPVLVTER
jgi:aryl-alcohol dehydrogenase